MTKLPKRILFARAADLSNLNAQAKNVQYILRHWKSQEYKPSVVAFSTPDPRVAANPNVEVLHLRNDRLWRVALFALYMRGFDAVFCPGLHYIADWLALKTRALLGHRLVVISTVEGLLAGEADRSNEQLYASVAGHEVHCQTVPQPILRRAEAIDEMADHIIAISPFLARLATSRYGSKVSTLPLGVDKAMFVRSGWNRRTRPRVIGAGTVGPRKRPQLFIKLARIFPQADFVWYGEGELRASLQAEAAHGGLSNIEFPGAVDPEVLAREFTASDIFILPSLAEGVPKVTQEAAAAGLAQIIFGFYEAPTVRDGVNGFVVWNDDELVPRLGQMLKDPDMVAKMGRAGVEMATAWSWDIVAPQWEQRIIGVLEGGNLAKQDRDSPLAS